MPAKSKAQQKAAGAALAAKRGETNVSELKGASREMYRSMSERQLEEFAGTKRKASRSTSALLPFPARLAQYVVRGGQGVSVMCRNIKPLFNFDPPATEDEIEGAALQFVRKISGFTLHRR